MGGGVRYMDHDLLGMCGEAGSLVWHECIFAFAQSPASGLAILQCARGDPARRTQTLPRHIN
jgi:hypothetical protein